VTVDIVMVAYNEAESIEKIIRSFYACVRAQTAVGRVVVAEEGSTDGTRDVLVRLSEELPLKLVLGRERKGYARAVQDAVQATESDVILFVDSDGQYLAEDFSVLWNGWKEADMVVGRKVKRADPAHRVLMSRVFHFVMRILFGIPLIDPDCGYRLIRGKIAREVARQCVRLPYSFWSEFSVRAYYAGARIVETPIRHQRRASGTSRVYPFGKIPRVILRQIAGLVGLWLDMRAARSGWEKRQGRIQVRQVPSGSGLRSVGVAVRSLKQLILVGLGVLLSALLLAVGLEYARWVDGIVPHPGVSFSVGWSARLETAKGKPVWRARLTTEEMWRLTSSRPLRVSLSSSAGTLTVRTLDPLRSGDIVAAQLAHGLPARAKAPRYLRVEARVSTSAIAPRIAVWYGGQPVKEHVGRQMPPGEWRELLIKLPPEDVSDELSMIELTFLTIRSTTPGWAQFRGLQLLEMNPGWVPWTPQGIRPMLTGGRVLRVAGLGALRRGQEVMAQLTEGLPSDLSKAPYLRVIVRTSSLFVGAKVVLRHETPRTVLLMTFPDRNWHEHVVHLPTLGVPLDRPSLLEVGLMAASDVPDGWVEYSRLEFVRPSWTR
jgi:hypothetical protein